MRYIVLFFLNFGVVHYCLFSNESGFTECTGFTDCTSILHSFVRIVESYVFTHIQRKSELLDLIFGDNICEMVRIVDRHAVV